MDFEFKKRVELPSIHEVFYAQPEPTYILDTDPCDYRRLKRPHPLYHRRDLSPVRYRTQALVADPYSTQAHVVPAIPHPHGNLVLSVPMCCDKCVTMVRRALDDMDGVRDVLCDQYAQRVVISGNVNPENVLRRVRRVKKKSSFWNIATQPIHYSGSSKSLINAYNRSYHTSAYRAPHSDAYYSRHFSPPRHYTSSSRAYSSPYIDSEYRSGYVESSNRLYYDEMEYGSRFDRGSPFVEMDDAY